MATTKLFPITATERKAISYIADGSKTDNGRLISTFCCSSDPAQASRDFASVRACGTGKNKILSQHFVQSFKPGEITPERALEVGEEHCEKFLKGEYQYFLAVHIDKSHVHLHVIFNNCNMYDYKTFETHEDQGCKKERAWKKLFDLSDEICKRHHLSVIQHPELQKGKKRWEWELDKQGLSWKSKLKRAIDEVVKHSVDFEDFLAKCADYGVIVDYNPDHKIDLKFMLAEHKEHNPNARFTRARTLGGYYETENIKKRIAQYLGTMAYVPRTKIRVITQKPQNKFVQDAIDRGNMKIASIAKNIIAKYGIEPEQINAEATAAYAKAASLVGKISSIDSEIKELKEHRNWLREYNKVKLIFDEWQSLSGRKQKKHLENNRDEIDSYYFYKKKILEAYPDGTIPSDSLFAKKIKHLTDERSKLQAEQTAASAKSKELMQAKRDLEAYLRQYEPQVQSRDQQKKKKRDDLE